MTPRLIGLVFALAFAVWLAGPVEALAVKCGGRKATIVGSKKRDVIRTGKGGVQVIHGMGGNDLIISKRNKDIVCGGPGDDRLYTGTGRDNVYGGGGNDYIDEGPGSGKARGGSGDDVMVGGGGGDRLRGGGGADRLFGEIQDDKLYGDAGDDLLVGGQGSDRLTGGGGDDWVRGDTNQDKYNGGGGTDTISYATATPPGPHPTRDGVTVDLAAGFAVGDDSFEGKVVGFENLIGSAFEDTLTGGGGEVRGNGGVDECSGFAVSSCLPVGLSPIARVADGEGPDPGVVLVGSPQPESVTISETGNTIRIEGSTVVPGQGCVPSAGVVLCSSGGAEFGYILLWGRRRERHLQRGRRDRRHHGHQGRWRRRRRHDLRRSLQRPAVPGRERRRPPLRRRRRRRPCWPPRWRRPARWRPWK